MSNRSAARWPTLSEAHPLRPRRLRRIALALALLPLLGSADVMDPDCRCRAPDGDSRALGTVECVSITGSAYLVRCEMSNNTPYWRRLLDDKGCPAA